MFACCSCCYIRGRPVTSQADIHEFRYVVLGMTNHWGLLWRALRARIPNNCYRDGMSYKSHRPADDGQGVTVEFQCGTTETFDVLVGADGYNSHIRTAVHGSAIQPEYVVPFTFSAQLHLCAHGNVMCAYLVIM